MVWNVNDTRIKLIRSEDLEMARIFCGGYSSIMIQIHESRHSEGEGRQAFYCGQLIGRSIAGAACIDRNQGFRWLLLVGKIADMVPKTRLLWQSDSVRGLMHWHFLSRRPRSYSRRVTYPVRMLCRNMETWIKQDHKWLLINSFLASCDKLPPYK